MRKPLALGLTMEPSKVTSKTSSLKALLLRAWRERWSDLQWGIHIKTILPRGVSGDVYNLADCILAQALVGPGPNQLVLSYLKHSLSSQLVSHAAVLQRISKYDGFHKPHCILSLLEFLENILSGITSRGKPEEGILAGAVLSLTHWLLQCYHFALINNIETMPLEMLDKPVVILEKMLKCDFVTALLYLAKHEDDKDLYLGLVKKCQEVEAIIVQNANVKSASTMQDILVKLCNLELGNDDLFAKTSEEYIEPLTYCLQALLAIEVLLNPSCNTQVLVSQLLMIQRIKGYTNVRLYCELMRACLMTLNDVLGTSKESQWVAFTFLKVPHLLQQLHKANIPASSRTEDFSQEVVDSLELLMQFSPLLDTIDARCSCNNVECFLSELVKLNLVSESHAQVFTAKRLEQVGEEFCGSQSEELQNSVKTQSTNYFWRYHASRLDELQIFLENEVWTPCPVRSDFSLLYLQEFRGLRNSLQRCADTVTTPSKSNGGSLDGSSIENGFFSRYLTSGTPFDFCPDMINIQDEEILVDITDDLKYYSEESDDEDVETMAQDAINSNRSTTTKRRLDSACPLLTNTTLTVLRHCGKYLQMSRLLRSNATDVIVCLSQLFEYYLYAIYSFFASDIPFQTFSSSNVASIKLQAVLKRIKDSLIQNQLDQVDAAPIHKLSEPNISPVVDLTNSETLYGLAERIVAVESLAFLADQFNFLKSYLEQLQPQCHSLHQLYNQTVCVATDVRKPVYACVAWRTVDVKQAIFLMSRVNWEVKDVRSEHSQYVDILLRELQIFSMRLEDVGRSVTITQPVLDSLWENIAHLVSDIFVEGFSTAKKCSNGGRGLMQLDFTQLVSQLEKMCKLRPIPHSDFVEAYVKAYYRMEQALEDFIREHNEYSSKQLLALVSCACQNNKKTKQRLCALIEELDKTGAR